MFLKTGFFSCLPDVVKQTFEKDFPGLRLSLGTEIRILIAEIAITFN